MRSYSCSNAACTACALCVTYRNACALRWLMLREGGGVFPSLRKCIFPHVHDFVHAETISLFCESWPQHHRNRILLEIKQLVLITGREFSILFFSQVEITEISSCSQRFCRRNCTGPWRLWHRLLPEFSSVCFFCKRLTSHHLWAYKVIHTDSNMCESFRSITEAGLRSKQSGLFSSRRRGLPSRRYWEQLVFAEVF